MSNIIQEEPADVVCLGLGVMSGIVATELSVAGNKVVGIEKGPYWDYVNDFSTTKYDEWGIGLMHKFDHPLSMSTYTFRNNDTQFANPSRRYTYPLGFMAIGHGVGGAAQHYSGGLGRYAPWSYQMASATASKYGSNFLQSFYPNEDVTDWPLQYTDYEPYYNEWEKAWGVVGTNQDPFIPNVSYPLPPHPVTPLGTLFQSSAESLGYTPFPSVSGLASQAYVNQYGVQINPCVYDGWCASVCNYQCETGAKANSAYRVIPAAVKSGNFTMALNSYVFRLDTDPTTGSVTAVRYYDVRGNVHLQPGRVFYSGTFGWNNYRLQMLSGIGDPYNPTTKTGSLGRAISWVGGGDTPKTTLSGKLTSMGANAYPAGNASGGGFTILDFADDNFDHTGLNFIGGGTVGFGGYAGSGPGNLSIANGAAAANVGGAYKASVKNYYLHTSTTLSASPAMSTLPNTSWFYDLDPHYTDLYDDPMTRITLDVDSNAYNSATYLAPLVQPLLEKMGATNITLTKVSGQGQHSTCLGNIHVRGGARLGTSPDNSFVNKWHQVWTAPNLFVGGELCNPTGDSITAGTHTIGPTAYVASEGIKQYLQSPGMLA